MSDTLTERLVLHPIDAAEAERILAGTPTPEDRWAADYPFEGDRVAVTARRAGEQRPWGYYQIRRREGGEAIGGIGFFGPPDEHGRIEIGYGLVPGARGASLAAEALAAMASLAASLGARVLVAETTRDNLASQRVMEHVGMRRRHADEETLNYELSLR